MTPRLPPIFALSIVATCSRAPKPLPQCEPVYTALATVLQAEVFRCSRFRHRRRARSRTAWPKRLSTRCDATVSTN